MNKLSELFQQTQNDVIELPATWQQGRAYYGGLIGALLFARARHAVGEAHEPRLLAVSFVAPAQPGAAQLAHTILRQGKSVTQVYVTMSQNEQVIATLSASFGKPRESKISVPSKPLNVPNIEGCDHWGYIEGFMPEFFQHLDVYHHSGAIPFSGSDTPDFTGFMRLHERWRDDEFNLVHLMALIDGWPPATLSMADTVVPASSLTWSLEFVRPLNDDENAQSYWWYQVETDRSADGYAHSEARISNQQGELIAVSRQVTTVFY